MRGMRQVLPAPRPPDGALQEHSPGGESLAEVRVLAFVFSLSSGEFNEGLVGRYKTAVHQCDVCKKEFKGKSSLEMHVRTHSGEQALL